MRLNGNDLVSLGLCFGVAGALILAKGYIFTTPVSIKDESASYLGINPFAIRNKTIQRWEGLGGLALILPATLFQLLGIFLSSKNSNTEPIFANSIPNFVFLTLLSVVLVWGTIIATGVIAKNCYMPELKVNQCESMEQAEAVLKSGGLYANEVGEGAATNVPIETRNSRLQQMRERLEKWERLFLFTRGPHESDIGYLLRLKKSLNSF